MHTDPSHAYTDPVSTALAWAAAGWGVYARADPKSSVKADPKSSFGAATRERNDMHNPQGVSRLPSPRESSGPLSARDRLQGSTGSAVEASPADVADDEKRDAAAARMWRMYDGSPGRHADIGVVITLIRVLCCRGCVLAARECVHARACVTMQCVGP